MCLDSATDAQSVGSANPPGLTSSFGRKLSRSFSLTWRSTSCWCCGTLRYSLSSLSCLKNRTDRSQFNHGTEAQQNDVSPVDAEVVVNLTSWLQHHPSRGQTANNHERYCRPCFSSLWSSVATFTTTCSHQHRDTPRRAFCKH